MLFHSVSSVVNVQKQEIGIHDHYENYNKYGYNDGESLTSKILLFWFFSNTLDDPENIEPDLNAHCDSSNKGTLFRFARMVV